MRRALLLAVCAVFAGCSSQTDGAGELSPTGIQRVEARGEAARSLLKQGGKLVADYGAYQLIDAPAEAVANAEGVQTRDEYGSIFLNAGAIDTRTGIARASRSGAYTGSGKRLHLVQFKGPIQPRWYRSLEASGVRIVTFVPSNAYLVYGEPEQLTSLQQMAVSAPEFQWEGAYLDTYKLAPSVFAPDADAFEIQLVEDPAANADTLALANSMQRSGVALREDRSLGYVNLVVYADRGNVLELAKRPDVVSVHAYVEPTKNDERQNMIVSGHLTGTQPSGPGYLAWLESKGFSQAQFDASNFAVDITDSGVDNGTSSPNHFGLYRLGAVNGASRVIYARLEGSPNGGSTIQGCDGHGNINAHIVGGYNDLTSAPHVDAAGFHFGQGVAPWVKVGSSVIFDPGTFTSPDYEDLQSRAWRDGARISSNSWGANTSAYGVDSQRYDALVRDAAPTGSAEPLSGNQEMVILFAAGNNGSGASTVGRPGNAKNVITVGASENVHPFGGADQCGVPDTGADSAMDIISFSSRGPTADGRIKPELVAPGTHITGGVAQTAGQRADPPANPNGQANGCFDASGVCAAPGSNFFPTAGQEWFTASSGTSHSTPAVAGAAALIRQYFINNGWSIPTPAMSKAWLMNSARYMTGVGANDNLYSNSQGMGLMDLGMAFDGVSRMTRDQDPADLFTATAQVRTFEGSISDPSKPFRVTLAWTDVPGPTSGAAYVNNLDLSVTVGGNTYLGNVFTGPNSVTGGSADFRNNAESVFLPAGVTGNFTVTVNATNIAGDGVPGNASALDQDFALVIYNACTDAPAAITDLSATAPGDNQVELTWSPNGAGSYRIYRSVGGGPLTFLEEVAAPPFLDTEVSGGVQYDYVVRGKDCAEAPDSNTATIVATGACNLPAVFAGLGSATNDQASTCSATLSWAAATPTCGGAVTYNVYRGTTADFVPGVGNRIATGLTGTSFVDAVNLTSGSTYHYVVRAVEAATFTVEDENTVVRSVAPTGTITVGINYFDDLDGNRPPNAAAYFIEEAIAGGDQMGIAANCHFQSATNAYKIGAPGCGGVYPNNLNNRLVLGGNGGSGINGFVMPAGTNELSFRLWINAEAGYDGAQLEFSTTAATGPWTKISTTASGSAPYIVEGGYNGTLSGSAVWTGADTAANGALRLVRVNLDALSGQTVWFSVRLTSDFTVQREGAYLDDFRVYGEQVAACTTGSAPPGPAVGYTLTGPATAQAGTNTVWTVTALDAYGQVATSHSGTAQVSSSDPQMTGDVTATFASGVAVFNVTFGTTGTQTVTAADTVNPEFQGTGSLDVTPGVPVALQLITEPSDVQAGEPIAPAVRVAAVDVYGNQSPSAEPVVVALANNPSGATLGGTLTRTPAGAVATFGDLELDLVGAGYTLTFSSGTLTGVTSAGFSVSPGDPAALAVLTQPSTVAAGFPISPAPQVAIVDAFGNQTASTDFVEVSLDANPQSATLSGTAVVMAVNGVATFGDLSLDRVGTGYTLTATLDGVGTVTTGAFEVTPGTPHSVAILDQPTSSVAGAAFAPAVSAGVYDRFGNLATQMNGTLTASLLNGGSAQLLGSTSAVASGGVATFGGLAVDKAGATYALSVSGDGLFAATSSSFDIAPGAASHLAFSRQPVGATALQPLAAVDVSVTDAYGNPVALAVPVTVAVATGPTGATLAGTTTVTTGGGVASFGDLALDRAGAYTLQASASGLANALSGAFSISAGAVSGIELLSQPADTSAGGSLPTIRAHLHDGAGNTVTGFSGSATIALAANPGGASLEGATTVEVVSGVATFAGLSLDKAATGYTLSVTAGSSSVTTTAFNIGAAAANRLVFTAHPANGSSSATLSTVTVEVRDAFGNRNTAFADTIRLGLEGGPVGASLQGTTSVTATAGVATFSDLRVHRSGAGMWLVASATDLATVSSAAFTISSGPPWRFSVAGLPSTVTKTVPVTLTLKAEDEAENLANDYAGAPTVTSSDAAATLPGSVAFSSGEATVVVTFGSVGVHTLTFTDGALTTTATTTVTAFPQPSVRVNSHDAGDEVVRGEVEITAEAEVAAGTTLVRIELFVDGVSIGSGTSSPFTATWDGSAFEKGTSHQITAVVTDAAGNSVTSQPVLITLVEQGCGCASSGPGQAFALFGLALAMRLFSRRRSAKA